ncbi:MAG: hypothetical protein WCQ95_11700 [Bacteroidota bacterium]
MEILNNLLSAAAYAKLCMVTPKAISYRHYKGNLASVVIAGNIFVDVEVSPPQRLHHRYSPKPPHQALLPGNMNPNNLISVFSYCCMHRIRPDSYYLMAIRGKIQSWVIGDFVFILKSEADSIPKIQYKRRRRLI